MWARVVCSFDSQTTPTLRATSRPSVLTLYVFSPNLSSFLGDISYCSFVCDWTAETRLTKEGNHIQENKKQKNKKKVYFGLRNMAIATFLVNPGSKKKRPCFGFHASIGHPTDFSTLFCISTNPREQRKTSKGGCSLGRHGIRKREGSKATRKYH